MVNEFEAIVSPQVLQAAITAADLHTRWNISLEEATTRIKPMIEARPKRGTDFIDIVGRSQNQKEAKLISQSVADAYITIRNKHETERAAQALKTLDDELQRHGDLVQEKRTALTILIQSYGIHHFEENKNAASTLGKEEMLKKGASQLDRLEQDRAQLEIQLKKLAESGGDDLVRVAAVLELPENQVSQLYLNY